MCLTGGQKTLGRMRLGDSRIGGLLEQMPTLMVPPSAVRGLDTGCRAAMGLCGLDVLQVPQEASPGTRTAIGPCQVGLGKAPGCTVLAPRHGGTEEQAPGLRGSQAGRGGARCVDTPPVSLSAVSHPTSGMFSGTHKAINNLKS